MAKGFFTQGVSILLDEPISLDEIESALPNFDIRARHDANDLWALSGPSLIITYRPEINGYVSIDTVDECWPDDMGDPKQEKLIFGAWAMGHFGPYAYPGSLKRATEQCWAWEPGKTIPLRHKAFIRIRRSSRFISRL